MKHFTVIEDNSGEISLIVYGEYGKIEYIHTGYEYHPGYLSDDLEALKNGDDPAHDWDGNDLHTTEMENPEDLESWFPWEQKGIGWNVIADNNGIYPGKMGTAAHIEFGI